MRVTITDIATKLNISTSTVSRALKNNRRISESVRKLVNETAQEMGYRPNLLARSLVNEKTFTIGLVIHDISWSFFSELSQNIQNASESHGYSMFLYSSSDNAEKERIGIESVISGRSDGLIVYANEDADNICLLEQISKSGYPVVLLNNLENAQLDIVTVDNFKGTSQVMEYLSGLGHNQIAYIGPIPVKTVEKERLAGYEKFIKDKYGFVDRKMVFTGKPYPMLGYDITREMIKNKMSPTAIVVYNDTMALGVLRAILEFGRKIPDDFSVVGFDGLEIGLTAYPPLTTVAVPIIQMADTAVDLIVQRIEALRSGKKPEFPSPQKIQLEPQIVVRNSTGKATH